MNRLKCIAVISNLSDRASWLVVLLHLLDNFHPQKSFCTRNKTQSLSSAKSYSNGKSDQCGRYGITTRRSGKNDGLKTNERNMKRQASKLVRNMCGLKGK